jgi:hypothetical protein
VSEYRAELYIDIRKLVDSSSSWKQMAFPETTESQHPNGRHNKNMVVG